MFFIIYANDLPEGVGGGPVEAYLFAWGSFVWDTLFADDLALSVLKISDSALSMRLDDMSGRVSG